MHDFLAQTAAGLSWPLLLIALAISVMILGKAADWLVDESKIHPCNLDSAHAGFEIMMGLVRSAIKGGQVALPLTPWPDEIKALREALPDEPVLLTMPENAKEYL